MVDKGLYATMNRWRIDPFCESRMTKNDTTRHEKALLIDFIRYQRKEIKHFIRCYRIKNTVFILRYRIKFVLLPQKVCLIREKVVTFRMVKLNMLLSIFLITK